MSCLFDFQTLTAGLLSIVAAFIGAFALWRSSQAPIREAQAARASEDDRRKRYLGAVLTQDLNTLRHRCRSIEGTIKIISASSSGVSDGGRDMLMLPGHGLAKDWEFMSRIPGPVLSDLMKLLRHVDEHNRSMKTVGSFVESTWRDFIIDRLQAIAKAANALSGQAMLLAGGREPMAAAPIELD